MYEKELMMAILTSSTALAGLSAVVVGQVIQTRIAKKVKNWFRILLTLTLLVAILAITYTFAWFSSPTAGERLAATLCFTGQIGLFLIMVGGFWMETTE